MATFLEAESHSSERIIKQEGGNQSYLFTFAPLGPPCRDEDVPDADLLSLVREVGGAVVVVALQTVQELLSSPEPER